MVIEPKVRGFICTTAHPVGCALRVKEEIKYVTEQGVINGPKSVLVIGASTGYGLSSRIAAAFGAGAGTLGVFFERPSSGNRTATAGWYNSAAFEDEAFAKGLYAKSINGDAFSNEIKKKAIEVLKRDLGKVDLVIYSLAAPRRVHPVTGETFSSVLKPIGDPFTGKTVDFQSGDVREVTIEPAEEEEIRHTVAVMGGEDWELWIKALSEAEALAENAVTVAYSYVGPSITRAIYRDGTIGKAKDHLETTADMMNSMMERMGAKALVSVNKAVVTQSSSAIPVVPLYISLLYKVMKDNGTHEGCIEQMYRLLDGLYNGTCSIDSQGRVRLDDLEMRPDVQDQVLRLWNEVTSDNIHALSDLTGYRREFFNLFGFELDGVDYGKDVNPDVSIRSLK